MIPTVKKTAQKKDGKGTKSRNDPSKWLKILKNPSESTSNISEHLQVNERRANWANRKKTARKKDEQGFRKKKNQQWSLKIPEDP